jgi:hypothetical protein
MAEHKWQCGKPTAAEVDGYSGSTIGTTKKSRDNDRFSADWPFCGAVEERNMHASVAVRPRMSESILEGNVAICLSKSISFSPQ